MKVEMAGRDTPGEELGLILLVLVTVMMRGREMARTEMTEMTSPVVVFVMEGTDPTSTSPPSPFPPSALLLGAEKRV